MYYKHLQSRMNVPMSYTLNKQNLQYGMPNIELQELQVLFSFRWQQLP
jgi:hypothetical protein